MIRVAHCPRCRRVLRFPEGVKDSTLTCPRCLAKIDNPNLGIRADAPGQAVEMPPAVTGRAVCPSCGRPVEKLWGYCPSCRWPLDKPYRVRRRPSIDKEARGDTAAIGLGLVLISLLGAFGITFFFCGGPRGQIGGNVAAMEKAGTIGNQMAGTIGMIISAALFGTVVVGMTLAAKSRDQGMRTGTIVTGAVTIPLLVLAGAVSWFIYVCGGCSFK